MYWSFVFLHFSENGGLKEPFADFEGCTACDNTPFKCSCKGWNSLLIAESLRYDHRMI